MSSIPPAASSFTGNALPLSTRFPSLPADRSWTALLAATEWGVSSLGRRHVRVQHKVSSIEVGALRLVVQCYSESDTTAGRPRRYARPLGSAQRTVTAAELARGVQLDVLHFESEDDEEVLVLAWIEPCEPDLEFEFDGLELRPGPDTVLARVEAFSS